MNKVKIEYLNGNAKGQQREMAEKIAKILIKAKRVKLVKEPVEIKEDKTETETKELKVKAKTKKAKI